MQIVSDFKRAAAIVQTEYPVLANDAGDLIDDLDDLDDELRELFALLHQVEHELVGGASFISRVIPFARTFSSTLNFKNTFDGIEASKEFVDRVRVYLGQKTFTINHARLDMDLMERKGMMAQEFVDLSDMDSIIEMLNLRIADLSLGRMALREPV